MHMVVVVVRRRGAAAALLLAATLASGCATQQGLVREMEVTAYCPCRECTNWERGSWRYLKLDFWNRTVNAGSDRGRKYTGKTAAGEDVPEGAVHLPYSACSPERISVNPSADTSAISRRDRATRRPDRATAPRAKPSSAPHAPRLASLSRR